MLPKLSLGPINRNDNSADSSQVNRRVRINKDCIAYREDSRVFGRRHFVCSSLRH